MTTATLACWLVSIVSTVISYGMIRNLTCQKSQQKDDSARYSIVKAALEDKIIHWVTDKPPKFYLHLEDKFSADGVEITKAKDGFWVKIEDKHFKFGPESVCKRVFEKVWDADELLARVQAEVATKDPFWHVLYAIKSNPALVTKVDDDGRIRCILGTPFDDYTVSYWYGLDKGHARGVSDRLSGESAELAAAIFARHMKKKET